MDEFNQDQANSDWVESDHAETDQHEAAPEETNQAGADEPETGQDETPPVEAWRMEADEPETGQDETPPVEAWRVEADQPDAEQAEADQPETEQAEACPVGAAQVEAESDQTGPVEMNRAKAGEARKSNSRLLKIVSVVAVVAALGIAAYMITPKLAASASMSGELTTLRAQLQQVTGMQLKLGKDLAQSQNDLAGALGRAETAETAVKASQDKLVSAELLLKRISADLESARDANAPLQKKVGAVQKGLAEARADASEAWRQVECLSDDLGKANESAEAMSGKCKSLMDAKGKLSEALQAERRAGEELKRLLKLLDLGSAEVPVSDRPAEMPITRAEVFEALGQPTLTFADDNQEVFRWGQEHTAQTADGVVVKLDGQPACRKALASAGGACSTPAAAGAWRFGAADVLHYTDLVEMFGRPAGVSGAGSNFKAWWPVGAWARQVSVTVEDGAVTELAGAKVDPAVVCGLIPHRLQAYKAASEAAISSVARARSFYERAAKVIEKKMKAGARVQARDGHRLVSCDVAAFESVGVWIAPADGPGDSMTMRAAVNCTWVKGDGSKTTQRRYVVVTLTGQGENEEVDEFAVVALAE